MYITAMLVENKTGVQGTNVSIFKHPNQLFLPIHETNAWNIPTENPGERWKNDFELPPGGNRVRAYLDVICNDTETLEAITESLERQGRAIYFSTLPYQAKDIVNTIFICFSIDLGLEMLGYKNLLFHQLKERLLLVLQKELPHSKRPISRKTQQLDDAS